MGQDLVYRSAGRTWERRISRGDWELIQTLRQHLPHEIDLVFVVPELGEDVAVQRKELLAAAERIGLFLAGHADLLPYTYQFRCERLPVEGIVARPRFSTGAMSGLRLPDDPEHFYVIDVGVEKCSLQKWGIDANGKGVLLDSRDLRGERMLQTENFGTIAIRRTRASSALRGMIREIAEFANAVEADEVTKRVM